MADASVKVTTTTSIAYITSGAAIATGAFSVSSDIANALVGTGNLARYPRADVTLMVVPTATTASTSMNLYLYRRDINVAGGTNDDGIPGASNSNKFMGAFSVSAVAASTTSYSTLIDVPLPGAGDCEFYIQNALSGNAPAGWTLTVIPKTNVGATS